MDALSNISNSLSKHAEHYGYHGTAVYNFPNVLNPRGLKVTSGSVTIIKDESTNMIGISIGGGAPNCPCLYIVQVCDESHHTN